MPSRRLITGLAGDVPFQYAPATVRLPVQLPAGRLYAYRGGRSDNDVKG